MSDSYARLAKVQDIPTGTRKRFEHSGKRITVFNIDDDFFAILDTCPHKKTAPLLRGTLDGLGIKCPNHGYRFDLKTGECNIDPIFNTKVYPVKIKDDEIWISME